MTSEGCAYLRVQPSRALSVRQPWAWAILHAGKRVENRSRNVTTRGPFLLHASKECTAKEYAAAARWMALRGLATVPGIASRQILIPGCEPPLLPARDALPRGGFVGVASIVDVLLPSQRDVDVWHMPDFWGWRLEGVEAIPFRKATGALGFFKVNPAGEVRNP